MKQNLAEIMSLPAPPEPLLEWNVVRPIREIRGYFSVLLEFCL